MDRVGHGRRSPAYTAYLDFFGGIRSARAAASDETSLEVVRHELPHFFRIALCPSLVRTLEPKMVCGFFANHLSAAPATVAGVDLHIVGLDMAYMVVQFAAILLLALGVYRFALLWVDRRAAALAALATSFSALNLFCLFRRPIVRPTFAAPVVFEFPALPFEWVRRGRWRPFLKGIALSAAAAAAHHATLLFGSLLFALPVLALAALDRRDDQGRERVSSSAFVFRIVVAVIVVGIAIVVVLLPFWIALIKYPVTQTPIPHASRANYILSPEWGVNYFIVPYGALILAFPFILLRGSSTIRLRPLLLGFWLAFLLGIGGTTPVGRILLGRSFRSLTMERFSYWATLLACLSGSSLAELIERFRMRP